MGDARDRYGRKRLLLIGLGLFGTSSAAAAWAGSAALVVAARGVMGMGAAIMLVLVLTLVMLRGLILERFWSYWVTVVRSCCAGDLWPTPVPTSC